MARRVLVALLLPALLALAACGGDDPTPDPAQEIDAQYEQELRAVEDVILGVADRLGPDASIEQFPEIAAEIQSDLEEAAQRVNALDPPAEVEDVHTRLADAIERAAIEARALAERAADADELPPQAELEGLHDALEDADDAFGDLEEAGYEVRRRT